MGEGHICVPGKSLRENAEDFTIHDFVYMLRFLWLLQAARPAVVIPT